MTDKEMAKAYEEKAECIETDDYGHKVYGCLEIEQAFLDGLKAGRPQWHIVADGDLPKDKSHIFAYFKGDRSLVECLYIPNEGFKHPIFSEWYKPTAWIEKERILPKDLM